MFKKLFKWIFKDELYQLNLEIKDAKSAISSYKIYERKLEQVLKNIDVNVDIHEYSRYASSWAVISIQGQKSNFIKFIDLGDKELREISEFLRKFERTHNIKVDASPKAFGFLKMENKL